MYFVKLYERRFGSNPSDADFLNQKTFKDQDSAIKYMYSVVEVLLDLGFDCRRPALHDGYKFQNQLQEKVYEVYISS